MRISGIYRVQSIVKPERIYIGSAVNISKRWGEHLSDLRNNKHDNSRFQNHYNKYGESDLIFSVLLGCEKEDLLKTEQYFIDSYNPFFNICKIAGSTLGYKHTDKTIQKMNGRIPWNKGKTGIYSEESLRQMSNSKKDVKASIETCKKMSNTRKGKYKGKDNSMFGKHHKEESIKKLQKAREGRKPNLGNKGYKHSQETINNMREGQKRRYANQANDILDKYVSHE